MLLALPIGSSFYLSLRWAHSHVVGFGKRQLILSESSLGAQSFCWFCHEAAQMGNVNEPRHEKTCFREFPTRPDTNRPAQRQKLARDLKFRL